MNSVEFTATIGPDGVIHPPADVQLPKGDVKVSVEPLAAAANLEWLARQIAARRGLNWETLSEEARAMLMSDAGYEARGERPPRPGPGLFKGIIKYMAPDFDAPLEDMREYME